MLTLRPLGIAVLNLMENVLNWPPTWATLLLLPALFVGFTVHELAHAIVALLLGDTSQVERKRLSFNPLRHVSWLGMVAFMLVGFGWAKPLWVDYEQIRIKNRPFGMFLVSIAGPAANLLVGLAAFVGTVVSIGIALWWTSIPPEDLLRLMLEPGPDAMGLAVALSAYMMSVNLMLALFNMLPLPMMDGFHAVTSLYAVIRNGIKGTRDEVPMLGQRVPSMGQRVPSMGQRVPSMGQPRRPAAAPSEGPTLTPAEIHFQIGLDYHKEGQWDEAIARYRQAVAHDDQFALAYYDQGLALWAQGRPLLAANAFRGALQVARDPILRTQASLRLHELAQAEQNPDVELGPAPPPHEPGSDPEDAALAPSSLDPEVERRVWLRLGIGVALMVLLAVAMWIYVTVVMVTYAG